MQQQACSLLTRAKACTELPPAPCGSAVPVPRRASVGICGTAPRTSLRKAQQTRTISPQKHTDPRAGVSSPFPSPDVRFDSYAARPACTVGARAPGSAPSAPTGRVFRARGRGGGRTGCALFETVARAGEAKLAPAGAPRTASRISKGWLWLRVGKVDSAGGACRTWVRRASTNPCR